MPSKSAVPAVTTTAGMETNATETSVEATTRETNVKAPATETNVETTMMKVMMMKKPKPEPHGNAMAVIRE